MVHGGCELKLAMSHGVSYMGIQGIQATRAKLLGTSYMGHVDSTLLHDSWPKLQPICGMLLHVSWSHRWFSMGEHIDELRWVNACSLADGSWHMYRYAPMGWSMYLVRWELRIGRSRRTPYI